MTRIIHFPLPVPSTGPDGFYFQITFVFRISLLCLTKCMIGLVLFLMKVIFNGPALQCGCCPGFLMTPGSRSGVISINQLPSSGLCSAHNQSFGILVGRWTRIFKSGGASPKLSNLRSSISSRGPNGFYFQITFVFWIFKKKFKI